MPTIPLPERYSGLAHCTKKRFLLLTIPVTYKDREYDFPIEVVPQAYGMKFLVDVHEVLVVFETDDSGDLRAIIPDINNLKEKPPEPGLLQTIGEVLQSVMS